MKTILPLPLLLLGGVHASIPPLSITSQTPGSCSPSGGLLLSFTPDMSHLHASFPTLALTPNPSYHGNPARGSVAYCGATFAFKESQFGSGYQQFRLAIQNATVRGQDLRLEKGDDWNLLGVRVVLDVDVSDETSPVRYPVKKDKFESTLVDIKTNPQVAVKDAYHGAYSYTSAIANPVFTTCMRGRDYAQMNFDIQLDIETDVGGSSGPGWEIDFGLLYEECSWQPSDDDGWGQVKIKDWESCTYRSAPSPPTNSSTSPFPVMPSSKRKNRA
ncbi:hypothetical protein F5Y17DRAFT_438852 [Xylariaceae sp. FL0594]|nr:hypothetical protein F5Y17DRAFT_438852 [Xylariaceae sp. FL0594]